MTKLENNKPGEANQDTWCPEFYDCINEVTYKGAVKYAPRDWEQIDGRNMQFPKNCDAMFHHLAREFVRQEMKGQTASLKDKLAAVESNRTLLRTEHEIPAFFSDDLKLLIQTVTEYIRCIEQDAEMRTSHMQHVATRAVMGYTRQRRFDE
jgi:hypothetical protein